MVKMPEPVKPAPTTAPSAAVVSAPNQAPASISSPIPAQTETPILRRPIVEVEPPLPEGEFAILVESAPTGAMIVVNGIPVGRAPRRVVLPGTPQGFSRGTVSIKARFVAENTTQQSSTMEEELTPLDRLPTGLVFTPDRVQRKR